MRRLPAAAALLLLLLPACGKRGDPLPPLRRTPPALAVFRIAQRGDQLEIRYTAPRSSVEGAKMPELAVETMRLDGDGDLEKQGRRTKRKATPGEEVVVREPLPPPGTVVRIAARALVGSESSPRSGPLVLRVQPPFPAPSDLVAEIVPEGVSLAWKGEKPAPVAPVPSPSPSPSASRPSAPGLPPGASPPPTPPPFPGGFWVYRRPASGVVGPPLTAQPTGERKLTDTTTTLGSRWCYTVRAVAAIEPLVESASSEEACVDSKDVFAPAPPAGLSAVGRDDGVELTWSPSPEGDLAGYRVWRAVGKGTPERIAELPAGERQYVDTTAIRGTTYRYSVTAFDQAGNESAHSAPAEGAHP
jgi:Fibronectin type III domain